MILLKNILSERYESNLDALISNLASSCINYIKKTKGQLDPAIFHRELSYPENFHFYFSIKRLNNFEINYFIQQNVLPSEDSINIQGLTKNRGNNKVSIIIQTIFGTKDYEKEHLFYTQVLAELKKTIGHELSHLKDFKNKDFMKRIKSDRKSIEIYNNIIKKLQSNPDSETYKNYILSDFEVKAMVAGVNQISKYFKQDFKSALSIFLDENFNLNEKDKKEIFEKLYLIAKQKYPSIK